MAQIVSKNVSSMILAYITAIGASEYFKRTENIAGVKVIFELMYSFAIASNYRIQDMRFQALMPDVCIPGYRPGHILPYYKLSR